MIQFNNHYVSHINKKYVYINCVKYVHMLLTNDTAIQKNQTSIQGHLLLMTSLLVPNC